MSTKLLSPLTDPLKACCYTDGSQLDAVISSWILKSAGSWVSLSDEKSKLLSSDTVVISALGPLCSNTQHASRVCSRHSLPNSTELYCFSAGVHELLASSPPIFTGVALPYLDLMVNSKYPVILQGPLAWDTLSGTDFCSSWCSLVLSHRNDSGQLNFKKKSIGKQDKR